MTAAAKRAATRRSSASERAGEPQLQVRMRVRRGRDIAFGPGKGDLLQAIAKAGSLLAAARLLKMSYMRAWSLVQEMHRCFREPLVELNRGGTTRGGAKLTAHGEDVLQLYLAMEDAARTATQSNWRKLQRHLKN